MIAGLFAAIAVAALGARGRVRCTAARRGAAAPGRRRPPPRPGPSEWATLLDTIAADVRGGTSLTTAMSAASRRCALTGRALTPRTVLTEVDRLTTTDPHEAVAVQAISAAAQLGGPVAATLHSGATMLRERAAVRAETLAHSAQARLSARVLTGVPLAFAAWSLVASGSFRTAIVSPAGLTAAALGVGCNLLGWWWMRRLIDRAAS